MASISLSLPPTSESLKSIVKVITMSESPAPSWTGHIDTPSQPNSQIDNDELSSSENCAGEHFCSGSDEGQRPKSDQNLSISSSELDVLDKESSLSPSVNPIETNGPSNANKPSSYNQQSIPTQSKGPEFQSSFAKISESSNSLNPSPPAESTVPISVSYSSTATNSVNPSSQTEPTIPSSASTSSTATPKPDNRWNHTVTAYFGSGNTNIFPPSKIPWNSITHLCYAFAKTQNASANWTVSVNDTLLRTLSDGARENGVDLLLSIGGYGEGGRYFSDLVHTNASINAFVSSFKIMAHQYGLAGIDIGKWPHCFTIQLD